MKKIKLYCFPYAGSSASMYLQWKKHLNSVEVCPVELGGRGRRFSEPLFKDLDLIVEDVYMQMREEIDQTPYALFGHSLGSLIVDRLAIKILEKGHTPPQILFFSGRKPPHLPADQIRHHLSDDELKKELIQMGGVQPDLFENEELYHLFAPIIRADLQAAETYDHTEPRIPFDIDLVILNGLNDHLVKIETVEDWRDYTTTTCHIHHFNGGHFFIRECEQEVLQVVQEALQAKMEKFQHDFRLT
ncbi:thioesterase II family protein [Hazenella coriacea]|uniref:Surfactin synthase thioesterase subunit n=1 Tax=Hazenella coriacea TaxID=1179467 RepID=A0A4R3L752_9BACL|nr:thioesterase domain-containing protein [Hazenella coriacea]TCS95751.1 surfactin synthase thioesterase subunit [Hazenella coriacea]